MVINDIMDHGSLEEVLNNNTLRYGIDLNTEIQYMIKNKLRGKYGKW